MKNQNKILLGVLAAVVVGAVIFASTSTELLQGKLTLKTKNLKTVPTVSVEKTKPVEPPPVVDLCANLDGVQAVVPTGFIIASYNHDNCDVDKTAAGILTVERDPNWVSRSVAQGSVNATFTKLNFSTTGTLPITIKQLNIIATTGNTNIDYIRLLDADAGIFLTDLIHLDALGKATVWNLETGLFVVNPGTVKHITIVGTLKSNAQVDSQTALGIFINLAPDHSLFNGGAFLGMAGDPNGPYLFYSDSTAQFSDGTSMNRDFYVSFHDNVSYNAEFHVIAGEPMTVSATAK